MKLTRKQKQRMTDRVGQTLGRLNDYVTPTKTFIHEGLLVFKNEYGDIMPVYHGSSIDENNRMMSHAERYDIPPREYIKKFTRELMEEITTGTFVSMSKVKVKDKIKMKAHINPIVPDGDGKLRQLRGILRRMKRTSIIVTIDDVLAITKKLLQGHPTKFYYQVVVCLKCKMPLGKLSRCVASQRGYVHFICPICTICNRKGHGGLCGDCAEFHCQEDLPLKKCPRAQ